jgi:hypothetical protein
MKDEESEYYRCAMLGSGDPEMDARLRLRFVISEGGGIVTNAHVARPDGLQAELTVETLDGRTFPARVIGVDAASDLALLKIDTDSIPPLEWGDSSAVRVGQEAWAIGNPLDIGISITAAPSARRYTGYINQVEGFIHSTRTSPTAAAVDCCRRPRTCDRERTWPSPRRRQGFSIPCACADRSPQARRALRPACRVR